MHHARSGGVLSDHCKVVMLFHQFGGKAHQNVQAQRGCACLNDFNGLWMAVAGHNDVVAFGFDGALGQGHGFGGSRGFVQHGGVGNRHSGQVAHHGLEVDQGFHAALANFSLVGRVSGVPSGVFQNVAKDHTWCVITVIALTDETFENFVLLRHGLELCQCAGLGDGGWQLHGLTARNGGGHDAVNQRTARSLANDRQHVFFIGLTDANVACNELALVFELA